MRQGKLGRDVGARRALLRSLVTNLFLYNRIETTEAKAKAMRPVAERLITKAKKGNLHNTRLAAAYLTSPEALKKLFEEIGPKFVERPGGYTRIMKTGMRRGDAAPMAIIELVGFEPVAVKEDKKVKKAAPKKAVEKKAEPKVKSPLKKAEAPKKTMIKKAGTKVPAAKKAPVSGEK
ncbi:MAG TPA: 50S ribosomal protein L17 [Bacillota bacterium]|nr:50S ribosomal protein L17 [Bacillota bacterium]HOH10979.1 50S ribosomal protein L17 [Bacillota bacterium]HOS50279.1 50S ribosomal protein L17 [Bacillota bacterium]HOY89070.1 50S ribosomal protein L17 [Bacillota bacterium]HPI02055.1 50S ribosomal protein L17 [Bacillota bacterium]